MTEAAVDHDPAGADTGVCGGQRVEQVADAGLLTAEPQLDVRFLTDGVVEYDAHLSEA